MRYRQLFKDQSEDITVLWGCAMRPNCDGDRSGKTMTECSGAEILYELVSCFNLDEVWDDIRETVVNVIPCHRRYGTSYLSPVNSKLEISDRYKEFCGFRRFCRIG